ncbi:MAG: hypothetical protein AAF629_35130 [Chloroflexota bacterium]
MKLDKKAHILNEQAFLGFPPQDFERGGREQFIYLLKSGLYPDSKVADLGCGVLRAGYWLINFLNAGCYCGIEPHVGRLEMGINSMIEAEVVTAKEPRFDTNPYFDTSVFKEKFDFFLAYSIWTHASKQQIQASLNSFIRDAKETGVFLTSYLPADKQYPDYTGDRWYGTSHESDIPGCIHHSLQWIQVECERRQLVLRELGQDETYGQSWLEIKRMGQSG